MTSPLGAQQQQQSLVTSPYGAGADGSVAALAQRSAALEARLGPSVVGVSEADATAKAADRVADGAAVRLDTLQNGAARRTSDAGRRALDAALAGPTTYSPAARAPPRSRHDTPSRAARPSLAGSPAVSVGRPSPAAYLGLGHRRLVLDAEARSSPTRRNSRPWNLLECTYLDPPPN